MADRTINIRLYTDSDIEGMIRVWNEIIDAGIYFDYDEDLSEEDARTSPTQATL